MTTEAFTIRSESEHEEQRLLRTGRTPWNLGVPIDASSPDQNIAVDVLVIGAGVTGAMTAELLTRAGRRVAIVDAMTPTEGSTAASTAMLLWEIDTPLVELSAIYGFDKAQSVYRRSLAAVSSLGETIGALGLDCRYHRRPSLYLASGDVGAEDLIAEHRLRERAGLPGHFLDGGALYDRFGIDRPAAILSPDSAEADPAMLSRALLLAAMSRGAKLFRDEAVAYAWGGNRANVALASGHTIEAGAMVLATGYRMPAFVPAAIHTIVSTWCLATQPEPNAPMWPERALIWEAGEPYLYARTTFSNEIVVGGEDQETRDVAEREALMPAKSAALQQKLSALWPHAGCSVAHAWSAEFGETSDGLPLIGAVPGAPGFYAAYGYGGNGITYSYLAANIIAAKIRGEERPWFEHFALDRDAPDPQS